jgi:hypothetical protein
MVVVPDQITRAALRAGSAKVEAPTLEQQGFMGTGLARLEPGETLAAEQTWTWDA